MVDLDTLNSAQREAVLDFDHNLLLLACAGSGKTRTVTSKISYAIENGIYKPSEIVAVTFTNRAAKEMKDRVKAALPDRDLSFLEIRTFHSLGAWLLRRFYEEAGLERDFCIYDDDDSLSLLSSVVRLDKKELRIIQRQISKAKDLGLSPDSPRLSEISSDPDFRVHFRSYEDALRKSGNVDFADLILKATELLSDENSAAARYCHNRFHFIVVDEYQDSNTEQFLFLKALKGDARLVVVGDDDQSIYSFRGAEIKNILSFSRMFENVREIKLEKNYRSTDEILRPSSALIKHNSERHEKEIVSASGKKGSKPAVLCSMNANYESSRIANIIENLGSYDNTAILYRTNAQSQLFEQALTERRIPYKVVGALKFYEREEIKDGLAFLYLLMNKRDQVSFRRIINKPARGLGDAKVSKILSYDDDIKEALKKFGEEEKGAARDAALRFLEALENAEKSLSLNDDLGVMMTNALHATGLYENYEREPDKAIRTTKLENLSQLVNILSESGRGRESLSLFLEKLTLDSTTIGEHDPRDEEGVTLITMHNTKGLEYERVFVVGLEEQLIPGRNADIPRAKEEERRILYVAMTRAKSSLYLSFARNRKQWGQNMYSLPSSFLREIPKDLLSGEVDAIYKSGNGSGESAGNRFSSYKPYSNPYAYVGHQTSYKPRSEASNTPSWAANIVDAKPKAKVVKSDKAAIHFNVGDKVKSPVYGNGIIDEIEDRGDKRILTIKFGNKQAKFVESKAVLEKLS